jgi:hypothetical protein
MGYKFQFVTLAGFHQLNYGMFELARGYRDRGMSAYVDLQRAEFASEAEGYTATRHQREVGTGWFDRIAEAVSGGSASTTALGESTEADQFLPPQQLLGRGTMRSRVEGLVGIAAESYSSPRPRGEEEIAAE